MPLSLLVLIPAMEITGLILASIHIGFLYTVLWCIVSAYWGKYLISSAPNLKEEATRAYAGIAQGADTAWRVLTRFVAASLLIVPGLFTDMIAILLLIPVVQTGLLKGIIALMPTHMTQAMNMQNTGAHSAKTHPQHGSTQDTVIDADYTVVDEKTTSK